ncbi:MAG: beta-ketoacyl-[acyl-carrier-protein] synthase II [Phycisphaeraceae bacterium]|nr:MAG: beta-ketoacyl-[acyl-carrier-protein] synthase II [Phycisphaeraceae bacterium]
MSPSATDKPRVVITGMGTVTNLGRDFPTTWDGMIRGSSGISTLRGEGFEKWDDKWNVRIAGQIHDWDPTFRIEAREVKKIDRFAQLGLCAAIEAVEQSGLDFSKEDPTRCGVVIGSGIGGILTIEDGVNLLAEKGPGRLSPFTVPKLMANGCAGQVSIRYGLQGHSSSHTTACASSGHSIADAMQTMQRGEADVMISGGAEGAIGPICVAAFMSMRALSTRNHEPQMASRPFDVDRDGFVLAEGAGVFVLETETHAKARGATILCELMGVGTSSDAGHITAPDAQGKGAARSMRAALQHAGLDPTEIDYVNAHGTSTPLGDAAEVAACLSVFGDHARASTGGKLLISSTKSMHGHCLGGSGGVEMGACIGAIQHGLIPPTINLDQPDAGFDLDFVPHTTREKTVKNVMNNTFGFGGHNVTLILGRYDG